MREEGKNVLKLMMILLFVGIASIIFVVVANNFKTTEKVVKEVKVCNIAEKTPDRNGFSKKTGATSVIYEKAINGVDGQYIGFERHTILLDKKKCTAKEILTEKEIFGEKLVNYPDQGKSEFYKDNVLIYKDRALKDGMWIREYTEPKNIPVKVPNWAAPGGTDLYMTFISVSEDKVARLPMWGLRSVWIKTSDKGYTLMGGEVGLKNPEKGLTEEEVYTFMRYDQEKMVNYLGILFPASADTFENYLSFLLEEESSWKKASLELDEKATKDFFEGAIKFLPKRKKISLEKGWEIRKTKVRYLPEVPKGFTPAVDVLPTIL